MGHLREYKVAQKHKFTHSSLTLLQTRIVFMYESRCIHKHAHRHTLPRLVLALITSRETPGFCKEILHL